MTDNQPDRWLETSRRLIEALDDEVRSLGRGSITEMELALGRKETKGWWQGRVKRGYVTSAQLFGIFEFLGLNPARFIRQVLGNEGELELHRPKGDPPEIVHRAWARFHDDGGLEGTLGKDTVTTLDRMRYEEPQRAIDQATALIKYCPRELVPHLLGVAGSAWRLLVQLDKAEHAICAALQMAQRLDDDQMVGELLQRLSYVLLERGELEVALGAAERASSFHLRCDNIEGVGKTLVDQGIWLRALGKREAAISVLRLALKLLPEEERHNLAGALQTLGTCFRELGEPEIALEYAFQAEELTPGLPRVVADKVKWLRANAWADLGKLSEAEELLRSVVRNLAEVHLGEMALATCDLMRVYLMDGRITEAFEAATALRALVEPLRENKIASAAIAKLLRDGETGLTLALAEEVRTRIESELRHRPLWRCLWVVQDGH